MITEYFSVPYEKHLFIYTSGALFGMNMIPVKCGKMSDQNMCDEFSSALIPNDLYSLEVEKGAYMALKSKGDGECFYRSVSICLKGNLC